MAADGTIRIDTRLDGSGVKKGVSSITNSIKGIASALGVVKLVSAAVGTLSSSLQSAFNRSDTMEQFDRTMSAMTGDAQAADRALEELKATTKGTAYGLDVAAKATQNFVTRGMDMSKATEQVATWADAVAFYGKGTNEQFENVTDALAKMRTKGKVEMDQLDRLFDAGIDAVGMYAKVTGQSSAKVQDALSAGEISADQFIDTVTNAMATGAGGVQKIAGAAKEAGASWQGTMDNMKAAVTRGMLSIIDAIDAGLQSIDLPTLREMIAGIGTLAEETLGKAASAIGTIIQDIGPSIMPVIDVFKEAFQGITPAVKEVADAVYGFIKDIVQSLQSGGLKKAVQTVGSLFTDLSQILSKIAKAVLPVIADAVDFLGENLDKLIPLITTVVSGMKALKIAKTVSTWIDKMRRKVNLMEQAWDTAIVQLELFIMTQGKEVLASTTSIGALNAKEIAVGTLSGKIRLATGVQELWNRAMNTNPIGIVITAVTTLASVIGTLAVCLNDSVTSTKNLTETFETMGEGASNFVEGIDTAKSHLSEFDDTLFASSEEQQRLQDNMQEVQDGITAICELATKERRDYTAEEIQQLDEYFEKLNEMQEQEYERAMEKSRAIQQLAIAESQANYNSLADYELTTQEWVKTAQEQKESMLALINEQTTNEAILLNQRYGDQATMQNEAYAKEFNALQQQKQEKINAVNESMAEITAAYADGYAERANLTDLYSKQVGKNNESIESEMQRHNDKLAEISNLNLMSEEYRNELRFKEELKHEENMNRIWGELTDGMSEEQKEQLGVLIALVAQTEMYGGKINDKTQSTVDAILAAYEKMPPKMKKAAKDMLQPVYDELNKAEPTLSEKARSIGEGIWKMFKSALGIASPSKVMRKLSKYTWQGFELETDKAEPRLIDQAKELAQGIIKGFELPQASLPFHIDTTGLDVHSIAAYLEDTVRQGRASMSSAIMARAEQQIINQLDTSAIARACREGCEAADVTVEGELRAEFSADGRQLGEIVTPYVNKNMGLQRRALLRGGKA